MEELIQKEFSPLSSLPPVKKQDDVKTIFTPQNSSYTSQPTNQKHYRVSKVYRNNPSYSSFHHQKAPSRSNTPNLFQSPSSSSLLSDPSQSENLHYFLKKHVVRLFSLKTTNMQYECEKKEEEYKEKNQEQDEVDELTFGYECLEWVIRKWESAFIKAQQEKTEKNKKSFSSSFSSLPSSTDDAAENTCGGVGGVCSNDSYVDPYITSAKDAAWQLLRFDEELSSYFVKMDVIGGVTLYLAELMFHKSNTFRQLIENILEEMKRLKITEKYTNTVMEQKKVLIQPLDSTILFPIFPKTLESDISQSFSPKSSKSINSTISASSPSAPVSTLITTENGKGRILFKSSLWTSTSSVKPKLSTFQKQPNSSLTLFMNSFGGVSEKIIEKNEAVKMTFPNLVVYAAIRTFVLARYAVFYVDVPAKWREWAKKNPSLINTWNQEATTIMENVKGSWWLENVPEEYTFSLVCQDRLSKAVFKKKKI